MAQVSMRANKDQESGGYPIADPGDYFLKVKSKKDGTTKTNRQKVDLLIGIYDDNGNEVGSCFHTVTFISEGEPGHGIWLHVNHALGLPYDGEVDFDTQDYVDAECRGRVIQDEYNGKIKNKIEEFYTEDEAPLAGSGSPPAKAEAPATEVSEPPPAKKRNATPPKDKVDLEEVPF